MILQLKLDANAFTPDRLRDALAAFVKTAVQPDPTAKITSAWYHRAPDGSIFQGGVVKNDNKKTKGVIDLGGELAPGTVPFSTQLEECEAWVVGTERVYISVPKEAQPGPIKSIVWIARNVDHAPEIAPRYIGWFAHGR